MPSASTITSQNTGKTSDKKKIVVDLKSKTALGENVTKQWENPSKMKKKDSNKLSHDERVKAF